MEIATAVVGSVLYLLVGLLIANTVTEKAPVLARFVVTALWPFILLWWVSRTGTILAVLTAEEILILGYELERALVSAFVVYIAIYMLERGQDG